MPGVAPARRSVAVAARVILASLAALVVPGAAVQLLAQPAQAAQAGPNTWTIDPNHTASQFAVRHLLVSTVRGQFERTTGTVEYDGKDPTTIKVNVTIDAATVNTRVKMRDDDLRSDNFLNVAKNPHITFVSKKVEAAGTGRLKMTGDLTIAGVTREVVLDVEGPTPPHRQGPNLRVGASATTKINRHDFGLTYGRLVEGAPIVGDEVTITIDVEATKRATP